MFVLASTTHKKENDFIRINLEVVPSLKVWWLEDLPWDIFWHWSEGSNKTNSLMTLIRVLTVPAEYKSFHTI